MKTDNLEFLSILPLLLLKTTHLYGKYNSLRFFWAIVHQIRCWSTFCVL